MKFDKNETAVVMIDPQNQRLSETGVGWRLLRESLHEMLHGSAHSLRVAHAVVTTDEAVNAMKHG